MAKLENYRQWVQDVLNGYAGDRPNEDGVETLRVFDTERDHYQLMYVGWRGTNYFFGILMHLDIRGEKIWVQWNGTEQMVADDLMALGVAKEDIVLGFQAPFMRPYTGFAVE